MKKLILESERLLLRPLSFNELLHINKDELGAIENPIELDAIFDFVKLAITKKIDKMQMVGEDVHPWYTYWLIIDKNNENGIGFIGFKGFPDENGYSEVGYSVSPNYRQKGLMTEALEMLVRWANEFECSKGIVAKVLKTNIGSNKVLSNLNFKIANSTEQENNFILRFK